MTWRSDTIFRTTKASLFIEQAGRNGSFPLIAFFSLVIILSTGAAQKGMGEFQGEIQAASQKVVTLQQELEEEIHKGNFHQSNERLLKVFPRQTRTPAQTLVLGNMLFGIDPKLSYALHKQAAAELPNEPLVQLEWGMEQHRAKEYAGALAAYEICSKANPDFAPLHGLAADCLIRLGRTRDAAARWQESERARSGTLTRLESWVCDIYKDIGHEERRANLCTKALTNAEAAAELIAQDLDVEHDWWNRGPNRGHLAHDLTVLRKHPTTPRLKAAECAAECLLLEEPKAEAIRQILTRYGFLIDANETLPSDSSLLSPMLGVAIAAEVFTREQAREKFGPRLRTLAKNSKEATLHNIVANLYRGTGEMAAIERDGWEKTGDARFAAGYLAEIAAQKTLKADDRLLQQALREFPEDSVVLRIATSVINSPDEKLLVQAIKAEYRRFSMGGLISRPSAQALRGYFHLLSDKLK